MPSLLCPSSRLLFLAVLSLFATPSSAWTLGSSAKRSHNTLKMDLETPYDTNVLRRFGLTVTGNDKFGQPTTRHNLQVPPLHSSVTEAETSHGMPWSSSIDASYTEGSPFYMPFWKWQMNFMKEHLTNLRAIPCTSSTGRDMTYVENDGIRCHTIQFASDEYKCIRLTLMDAGNATQVFTSLWYPDPKFGHLPVLGVDLLQFNRKKHLCICDHQPISDSASHDHLLEPIRRQYPSLQGKMTKRFYDEDQFFSGQMLLARHDATPENPPHDMVFGDFFPAFQAYVQTHVNLIQSTAPDHDGIDDVLERHAAYDEYSSCRDPAHALLARHFGQQWADEYVYDILFPLSQR